jgi:hypothetical protein
MYNNTSHYVSVDIEAGGPVPFANKLLSIGAISYSAALEPLETFYMTIDDSDAVFDSETWNEFWVKHPQAYKEIENGKTHVSAAIEAFVAYVGKYGDKPRFVAKPTWFDYGWLRLYMRRYSGRDPFEMRVCDYAQQAWAMGIKLSKQDNAFPHHALYDALEQGNQFVEFMRKKEYRRQQIAILEHRISSQKNHIKMIERKLKHINVDD